jgi:hypothetical protein
MGWAAAILGLAAIYLAAGVLVAAGFVTCGIASAMPHAGTVTIGARIMILPGAAVLWPWVLARWARPQP